MASLKDTIVNGALRVIGILFAGKVQTNTINVPTASGGTTYGPGTNGQIIKSNGTTVYWASDSNTDTKVTQTVTTTSANYPLLLAPTGQTATTTTTANFGTKFQANPSTGNLQATKFNSYTLAAACAKGVDTSISAGSTSTNLPTSKAVSDFAIANQSDWNENDTDSPAYIKNRTHYYGPLEFGYVELFTSGTTGNPHYIPPYAYSGNSLDGSHPACALGARYRITLTPQSSYSGDWAGTYTFVATTLNSTDYTRGVTIANGRFAIYTQGTGSSVSWYIAATDAQYGGVNLYCNIKVEYDASYYLTAENVNVPSGISSFYPTGSSTNVAVACKLETKKYYDIVINGVTYSDLQPFETSDFVYVGNNSYTLTGYLIFTDTGTPNNNTWIICWSPDYCTLTPAGAVSSMSDVSFSIKYSENQKKLLDTSWIDGYKELPQSQIGDSVNPVYWDGNTFVKSNSQYGTCYTSAGTQQKTVYVSDNFTLYTGAIIHVKFDYTNTKASPTLNVNSTGAIAMYLYDGTRVGTTVATSWPAGAVVTFTYDGSYWFMNDYQESQSTNLSMGNAYGTCSTAAATTTKTVSLSGFTLTNYGRIAVSFTNDVPADSWLNVNSTGDKKIYYNGTAIIDGVILAGDVCEFVYNGTQWVLLSIDRKDNRAAWQEVDSTSATKKLKTGITEYFDIYDTDSAIVLTADHVILYSEHFKGYILFEDEDTSVTFPIGQNGHYMYGDISNFTRTGAKLTATANSAGHLYAYEIDYVAEGRVDRNNSYVTIIKISLVD